MHRIRTQRESDVVILTAEGELDAYAAPALTESLRDASRDEGRFLADLSKVSFLDSTALGVVVRAVNAIVAEGGQARVVLPETSARRIFEITTLDDALPVARTRAQALQELQAAGDGPSAPGP
jgi:anti-sigma B factor antagonist